MTEPLSKLNAIITAYEQLKELDPHTLNTMLQHLTSVLYRLEQYRADYHEKYEAIIWNETKGGNSVARSTNTANIEVPEMYRLRRIMEAGYRIADAIRTNISFIKSEARHL